MDKFEDYVYNKAKHSIESITQPPAADIYALSLYYEPEGLHFQSTEPSVDLCYNTESNFRSQIDSASDRGEARWNFAFWSNCSARAG